MHGYGARLALLQEKKRKEKTHVSLYNYTYLYCSRNQFSLDFLESPPWGPPLVVAILRVESKC